MSQQSTLPSFDFKTKLSFGGSLLVGRRRSARTLSTKRPIHLVLRSSKATGPRSLLLNGREIERILNKCAASNGIKLYSLANSGNHLHLVIRIYSRRLYRRFIRSVTGLIARAVLKINKHTAVLRGQSFWDLRPFSRLLTWGRDYHGLKNYLQINRQESIGFSRQAARWLIAQVERLEKEGRLYGVGDSPPSAVT